MKLQTLVIALLLIGFTAAQAQVHHQLTVALDPASNRLEVTDRITLDAHDDRVSLLLHEV